MTIRSEGMGELLSCPFCRELFAEEEGPLCPECELPLVPLHQLPLSLDALAELEGSSDPPEDQRLPPLYLGRGRGLMLLLSVAGLALFFQPWITLTRPDAMSLSGHELAGAHAPWLWGGAVAWFILIPLLLSRRSVNELRGIRVIATLFAAMTLGEATMLLFNAPVDHGYFSAGLGYAWGLYASCLVAGLGLVVALRLGGSLEDFRDLPVENSQACGPQAGESLH